MEIKNKFNIRENALTRGISYLSDVELIMLIVGSGTKDANVKVLSKKILNVVETERPENLVDALQKISGVGKSKALSIAASIELGRRKNCHFEAKIKCPQDIIPFIQHYAIKSQEHFITICLSGANEILNINVSSIGTINRTLIHPREIFIDAIKRKAAAIIICHNHPSGNCTPSVDDIESTNMILDASKILGIPLIDHIIINKNDYFSFVEHSLIETVRGFG